MNITGFLKKLDKVFSYIEQELTLIEMIKNHNRICSKYNFHYDCDKESDCYVSIKKGYLKTIVDIHLPISNMDVSDNNNLLRIFAHIYLGHIGTFYINKHTDNDFEKEVDLFESYYESSKFQLDNFKKADTKIYQTKPNRKKRTESFTNKGASQASNMIRKIPNRGDINGIH